MPDDAKVFKALLIVLIAAMLLNAAMSYFVVHTAREANRHATEANRHSEDSNRILSGRDFSRIYAEHAELKALFCELHPELKEKCAGQK